MTPAEWKARNRNSSVADIVEQAVMQALPKERAAWGARAAEIASMIAATKVRLTAIEAERREVIQELSEEQVAIAEERMSAMETVAKEYLAALEAEAKKRPIDSCKAAQWVWNQCACAATWEKEEDPNHLERMVDTAAMAKGIEEIQAEIKRLRQKMKAYPKLIQGGAAEAILALRGQGIDLKGNDGQTRPVEALFEAALQALDEALQMQALYHQTKKEYDVAKKKWDEAEAAGKPLPEKPLPEIRGTPIAGIKCGPYWHRSTHGCLSYTKSIEGISKLPGPDTMLLFAVVLFFRFCSLGGRVLQDGQPMPEGGKPHFAQAVEIITAVFPDSRITTENDAQKRLHKLLVESEKSTNTIGLVIWPNEK